MQHRNSAGLNPCRQIEVAFTYSFPFLPASSSISSTSYLKSRVKINAETQKRKKETQIRGKVKAFPISIVNHGTERMMSFCRGESAA